MGRKVKIKKYKSFEHKLKYLAKKNKIKPKKIYPDEKCHYVENGVQCQNWAVGEGQLCEMHGGEKRIRDNYIIPADDDGTGYALMKQIKGKGMVYDQKKHPIEFMRLSKAGLSEVEIAAEFKVSVQRLKRWAEDYELFSEAYDIGKAMYESWWLEKGRDGLHDPRNFNTSLFKFLTGNKLGYSEKVESKNFNVNAGVLVVPKTQSIEEWEQGSTKVDTVDSSEDTMDADFTEKEAQE